MIFDKRKEDQIMADNVNHPVHYTDGKYETIDFIERNLFDYHDGNAIKYISRAGKKDPEKMIEDLEKANWYIRRSMAKKEYDRNAITVHDYICDKKLSPALSAVVSLVEAGKHEEASEMLEAEIRRLKKEKEQDEICIKVNKIQITAIPYFAKVICVKSNDETKFTVGKVYLADGDRIYTNEGVPIIFKMPFYDVYDLNNMYHADYGAVFRTPPVKFIEYKGEA